MLLWGVQEGLQEMCDDDVNFNMMFRGQLRQFISAIFAPISFYLLPR